MTQPFAHACPFPRRWEHPGLTAVAVASSSAVAPAIAAVQNAFPKSVLKDTCVFSEVLMAPSCCSSSCPLSPICQCACTPPILHAINGSVHCRYGANTTFHLNDPAVAISSLFESLEAIKQAGGIREYSVGQSSLESIFRGFAQQATEQQQVANLRARSGTSPRK